MNHVNFFYNQPEKTYYDVLTIEKKFDNFETFIKSLYPKLAEDEQMQLGMAVGLLKTNKLSFDYMVSKVLLEFYLPVNGVDSREGFAFNNKAARKSKKQKLEVMLANGEIDQEKFDKMMEETLSQEEKDKLGQYMSLFCEAYLQGQMRENI
jgi:hypothetical protein